MVYTILGVELWILGIIIAIAGYVIPQIMIREHPRSWARWVQVTSAIFVFIGIGITFATK